MCWHLLIPSLLFLYLFSDFPNSRSEFSSLRGFFFSHIVAILLVSFALNPRGISSSVDVSHVCFHYSLHERSWICLNTPDLHLTSSPPSPLFDKERVLDSCVFFFPLADQGFSKAEVSPPYARINQLLCVLNRACQRGRSHFGGISWMESSSIHRKIIPLSTRAGIKHKECFLGIIHVLCCDV